MKFLSHIWKGAFIGALIGAVYQVYNGTFKGNLAEPEFIASYMGFMIPYILVGVSINYYRTRKQNQHNNSHVSFIAWSAILTLAILVKVYIDFPHGEGLFHPTHDAALADFRKACLTNLSSSKQYSEEVIAKYCNCWSELVLTSFEAGNTQSPAIEAKKADAACNSR